jgi:hypothetical protein
MVAGQNGDAAMRFDFFPDREADMLAWGRAFTQQLSSREGHFGVPDDMVASMVDAQAAFEEAYLLATSPSTRTSGNIASKNDARTQMERVARLIARWLGQSVLTNAEDRLALGLNVPKQRVHQIAPPSAAPIVRVLRIDGADVAIRLIDAERSSSRALPDGAAWATIVHCMSEQEPMSRDAWQFSAQSNRTTLTLSFDPSLLVGTPVFISAWWNSRRGQASEPSTPIRVRLGEGVAHPGRRYIGASFAPPANRDAEAA